MDDFNAFVLQVHFEKIPIRNLVSNQDYQRSLSQQHIQRAAENFDPYQINPVKVSRRDGINYVFNGQHTIEIVALASGSRDTPVWCMIYDALTYQHEADIFANQQKFVKQLLPIETFNANIEAENDTQLTIQKLVEAYGLKISGSTGPCTICAVSTLERIFTKYGYHVLSRVLRLISATWEGDSHSFSSNMLNAVAKMVVVYGNEMDDEVFKERLGEISIKQITRTARERRPGCMGYAEVMVIEYNGKKKNPANRLAINKLTTKESALIISVADQEDEGEEEDELPPLSFDPANPAAVDAG